jgi:hypothetical protein
MANSYPLQAAGNCLDPEANIHRDIVLIHAEEPETSAD